MSFTQLDVLNRVLRPIECVHLWDFEILGQQQFHNIGYEGEVSILEQVLNHRLFPLHLLGHLIILYLTASTHLTPFLTMTCEMGDMLFLVGWQLVCAITTSIYAFSIFAGDLILVGLGRVVVVLIWLMHQ